MKTPAVLVSILSTILFSANAQDDGLRLEGRVAFTEGPAWHPSGNVYFTDIENNRIIDRKSTRLNSSH